ncbi:hypothetical protein L3X38_025296 [Prunus dulcis]|uniref:Uncharacterized protein n=1 Tax=Prunus dulcis TaxID=3755 RepID=A0AAD4W1J9_PRUDU|nr:hypothetical protein L3X38_025296 [Prunus dulcis]
MSQPYWSWGSDVLECDAPSVAPRVCTDLDELNSVVQHLRNEVAVLHREKGELEERVLCLEKCTIHADVGKTEDAGDESHKTEDAREESDKTEDGGVAESGEQCIDMFIGKGECGEDVIVGVWQKRDRGKSEILGPVTKRRRAVLLSKEGWLDDPNTDMTLLFLREWHNSSGKWVGSDWTILDTTFQAYVGKEDKQHSNGLLGNIKGEGPKLAKSWSSVNHVFFAVHPTKAEALDLTCSRFKRV